jgi:hypothetical protein
LGLVAVPVARSATGEKRISQPTRDSIVIRNKERFDVARWAVADYVSWYRVNPSKDTVFPWLSGIARMWEFYRFRRLRFRFVSTCATTTNGSIVLAFDADPVDNPPTALSNVANQAYSVTSNIWKSVVLEVHPSQLMGRPWYYTRALAPNEENLRQTDVGRMYLGFAGHGATFSGGYLEVEYEIELRTPQTPPEDGEAVAAEGGGVMTAAMPFGDAPVRDEDSTLTATVTNNGPNTLLNLHSLSAGRYFVSISYEGTTIAAQFAAAYSDATLSQLDSEINATGTKGLSNYVLDIVKAAGEALVVLYCTAATITAAKLRIARYVKGLDS